MRVLAVGDVVGECGCEFLLKRLPALKREKNIDFCVVNGENAHKGIGITPQEAELIFSAGADVITGGNHSFRRKEIDDYLESNEYILRPANFTKKSFGQGYTVVDLGYANVVVINIMGEAYIHEVESPFKAVDDILGIAGGEKYILVDFHAEATGEKRAMGFYLDGKVSAVFGTHTHIQTSDEIILPKGTGYITDLGMVGAEMSCLGMEPSSVIERLKNGSVNPLKPMSGPAVFSGCIFDLDSFGNTVSVERVLIKERK